MVELVGQLKVLNEITNEILRNKQERLEILTNAIVNIISKTDNTITINNLMDAEMIIESVCIEALHALKENNKLCLESDEKCKAIRVENNLPPLEVDTND